MLTEVISGYLSDKYNLKFSFILFVFASLILLIDQSFISFIFFQVLMGISNYFVSGVDNAYLLKLNEKIKKDYLDLYNNKMIFRRMGRILASLGASLFIFLTSDYYNIIITQFIVALIGFIFICFLPNLCVEKRDLNSFKIKDSIIELYKNKKSYPFLWIMCAISLNFMMIVHFSQPIMHELKINETLFPLTMLGYELVLMIALKFNTFFRGKFYISLFGYLPIGLLLYYFNDTHYSLILIFLSFIMRACGIYFLGLFTKISPKKYKATFDSSMNFVFDITLSLFIFISTYSVKYFGVYDSLVLMIGLSSTFTFIIYKKYGNVVKQIVKEDLNNEL